MSAAAGVLLLALAAQWPDPTAPAATNAVRVAQAGDPQAERKGQPDEAPHRLGLGGSMGVSSRGGGGAFRYFFTDRAGLNMNVGFYRPPVSVPGGSGSTFIVSPSFIWMLTKPNPQADLELRPYVGGGLNYANGGQSSQPRTSFTDDSLRNRGVGTQVFGGVEATFKEAKAVAISAEVVHYEVATRSQATTVRDGTTFSLLFHFYVN